MQKMQQLRRMLPLRTGLKGGNMKRYRINTDVIDIAWVIFRNANIPEDFGGDDIVGDSIELTAVSRRTKVKLPFEYVNGNKVKIYFMADKQFVVGVYDLNLTYKVKDSNVPGRVRTYTIDYCDAFQLVARSCDIETPPPTEYVGIVENLRGYSAYEIWLMDGNEGTIDDYFDWLRKPAANAAELLELSENVRVESESSRVDNEQSRIECEHLRSLAEQERVSTENDRQQAEHARLDAEVVRTEAEEERVKLYERMEELEGDTIEAKDAANAAAQAATARAEDASQAAERAELASKNWIKNW